MNILCLIKYVPDVDNFKYDYETNTLVRENVDLILNPDDASALSYALKMKASCNEVCIEVITMGPSTIADNLKDLLRLGVDKATLINDPLFKGSDTYSTSIILSKYIKKTDFDLIFTGSHTLDGGTAHIGPQVAEVLNLNQFSNIVKIIDISSEKVLFESDMDNTIATIEMNLPAVLSISKEINLKLGYVRYDNLNLNVDDKFFIVTNKDLNIDKNIVGLVGSPTRVNKTYTKKYDDFEKKVVKNDDAGIEEVYQFLKSRGFINNV